MKSKLFVFLSLLLMMTSCVKKPMIQEGSNSVVYSRDYMEHYKIQTASMVQSETFVIGEVDVYNDALGLIAYSAFSGKTNDKADWVKDAKIKNLKLSENLEINLTNDNDNLKNNLVNCQLFFTYYPLDNSGKKKHLLANFVEYDKTNSRAIMQTTGEDLTKIFKDQIFGGKLELKLTFGQTPHDVEMFRLWYRIPFDFAYSFSSKEAGKKE